MTDQASKPTEHEKEIIAEYVKELRGRGFCKLDNSASDKTRLFNRFDDQILPFSFIENDFNSWLYRRQLECSFRSTNYITCTLPHVVGSRFIPRPTAFFTNERTGCTWVNTYRPYEPSTDSAEVSPLFLEFFERMVPDEAERHVFIQWIAQMFQHPEDRPSWHVMIPSDPGTGKGFLGQYILHPLVHHTSVVADYSRVTGRFSSVLEDNLLVLLDDCKSKSDATQTQLKSILSEERQFVERKQQQGMMVPTYTRFILASNERKPLHLEASERRWFVLSRVAHRVDRVETQAFIQKLADWLALPGSLCKVYNFFRSYSLEGFNPKSVPVSPGLASIVELSRNPHAVFLADFTEDYPVFTYSQLQAAFKDEGLSKPGDAHLQHLIEEVGFKGSRPRIDGKPVRLYHRASMPLEEAKLLYKPAEF